MDGYDSATYGDRIADLYDHWYDWPERTAATVEVLHSLAGDGPVLELAVGTGRVALPLARTGLRVVGVDTSPNMVEQLRAKPGGDAVEVVLGDMRDVPVDGPFSLAFVAFNSLFALTSQEDQLTCFANVAARLAPGGCFVLECFVPDLTLYDRGQRTSVVRLETDEVMLDVARLSVDEQRVDAQHVLLTNAGVRLVPVSLRYCWPSELDLMARLAGLRLRERWAGWDRGPFTASSTTHVSVYEKPA